MNQFKLHGGRFFSAIIFFITVLIALDGCSLANYGRLNSDPAVTRAFENYQVMPGYKYYYRGTFSQPFVIIGIKENFELDSDLWVDVDAPSKDFRTLIERISLQGAGSTVAPWGFTILDASGRDIGVWYSALNGAAIEVNGNQIVNLSPTGTVAIGNQPQ